MRHEISEFVGKISIMYEKAMLLQRLKYDTPLDKQDPIAIRNLIDDIQSLAGDVYNDRYRESD